MMCELQYDDYVIEYYVSSDNIHITDSYLITEADDMYVILEDIREHALSEGFEYGRSNESWVKEWLAHNVMYSIGISRDRTVSVDLDENESWWRLLLYALISLFN